MTVKEANILVVGLGGLGCPASLGLAKAGARRLSLCDSDRVEVSNLPRQLWHHASDVGRLKVDSAAQKVCFAFPQLKVRRIYERVDADNAEGLFRGHDLVLDATDGTSEKFILSDFSVKTGTPLIYAGAVGLFGQVMPIRPGGPCLRCLFETPRDIAGPTCAQAGILGPLVGAVGALQALTAVMLLNREVQNGCGSAEWLTMLDGATGRERRIRVTRRSDCACSRGWVESPAFEVSTCPR